MAGSGRTDSGVHARDQVFHFELPKTSEVFKEIHFKTLRNAIDEKNWEKVAQLIEKEISLPNKQAKYPETFPKDIKVNSIKVASEDFHSRDSCIGKRYCYTIDESSGDVFTNRFRWCLNLGFDQGSVG